MLPTPPRRRYRAEEDLTLTRQQARQRGFRPGVLQRGGDFRHPSTPTLRGYSTGYHESSVTTDTFNFLKRATDNQDGTHTLAKAPSPTSFFAKFENQKVYSSTLEYVLHYADQFRTDTAQTIMSAPKGLAAGHSGSGVSQEGQAAAHDLLRIKIMDLLQTDPKTPGLTEAALVVLQGAMTVASMAPGEIGRTLKGATSNLKGGKRALGEWEANRNEAKRRVDESFDELGRDEASFVRQQSASFLDSTQEGVATNRRRRLSLRATSPLRRESAFGGEVSGGAYDGSAPTLAARRAPGASLEEQGLGMTETFRAPRRLS